MTGGPGPHGLSDDTQAFVAGVLEDLPGLLAVGAPSLASYLRLIPQRWSAPYRCSGRENREPGVRLAAASTDASIEVRCLDPSANRYLLDGAVLALGLAGIERRLRPSPEGHRRSRATGGPFDPAGLESFLTESDGPAAGLLAELVRSRPDRHGFRPCRRPRNELCCDPARAQKCA